MTLTTPEQRTEALRQAVVLCSVGSWDSIGQRTDAALSVAGMFACFLAAGITGSQSAEATAASINEHDAAVQRSFADIQDLG